MKYCKENGIVVQAYSPLVQGRLDEPVLVRLASKVRLSLVSRILDSDEVTLVGRAQYGKDAAQIAIRWSLQHGSVPFASAF